MWWKLTAYKMLGGSFYKHGRKFNSFYYIYHAWNLTVFVMNKYHAREINSSYYMYHANRCFYCSTRPCGFVTCRTARSRTWIIKRNGAIQIKFLSSRNGGDQWDPKPYEWAHLAFALAKWNPALAERTAKSELRNEIGLRFAVSNIIFEKFICHAGSPRDYRDWVLGSP